MRRIPPILLCLLVVSFVGNSAGAQMGMGVFQNPTIAKAFHPVVGGGAVYQITQNSAPTDPPKLQELSVVGKEAVDGQDAYWLEFYEAGKSAGKVLITKSDFQVHRTIFQRPGQPAMELPYHASPKDSADVQAQMSKYVQVGTESITVPAGTFDCQHWKNDSGSEVWISDKVTPFGLIKEINKSETKALVKIITDAQDHITGPVKIFDPQQMMNQRKQQPN